jgi:hypothetical protein
MGGAGKHGSCNMHIDAKIHNKKTYFLVIPVCALIL